MNPIFRKLKRKEEGKKSYAELLCMCVRVCVRMCMCFISLASYDHEYLFFVLVFDFLLFLALVHVCDVRDSRDCLNFTQLSSSHVRHVCQSLLFFILPKVIQHIYWNLHVTTDSIRLNII